ncbi:MAG TPA: hypothetical protein VKN99_18410 [Polyangia bacterium]|nr:hypothetical protein [Polyangia bacterium]
MIAAFALTLAVLSWGRSCDVLIDFGKELYVAWQVASGRRLYADLAYLHGPLSPHVNGLLMRGFGVSLRTLELANLVVLGVVLTLLRRLLGELAGARAATVACLVFLPVFAFGHLTGIGNYNFVCPYTHEMTHGLAIGLFGLYCLARGRLAAVGLAVGLSALTKIEIFVPTALALGGGAALLLAREPAHRWRRAALWVGAALLPVGMAALLLGRSAPQMLQLARALAAGDAPGLRFFRAGMGTLDLPGSLAALLAWTVAWAAFAGGLALVALRVRGRGLALIVFVLVSAGLVAARHAVDWPNAARPLPVAAALAVVQAFRQRAPLRLAFALFALGLLGKMTLHARVHHYGFVLAAPATLLSVVAAVEWIPAAIARRGGAGGVFRAGALAVCVVLAAASLHRSAAFWHAKTERVGTGADAFFADPERGRAVNQALAELQATAPATLAVLPEGATLNYLLRRPNPTPYDNFQPTDVIVFGEDAMLAAFAAHPPARIALVHKDTSEFGYRFFGRDYAQRLGAWIRAYYRRASLIGSPPLWDQSFGIEILEPR